VAKTKKKQHYVSRAYLRAWSEDERIYCLREGKVFRPNLTGVACERFFYRLQDLTPEEARLIEKGFIEGTSEPLRTLQRNFLSLHVTAPRLRKQVPENVDPTFVSTLERIIAEGHEDFHQQIEDSLLVFLRKMLAGDTDFYSDARQAAEFLYDLCVQFTRTKQIREAAVAQIGAKFRGCDVRRMMGALSHVLAMNFGQNLYLDRKKFKLLLINNKTDTPFITADQPIINLQGTHTGKPPEKLEFFYPLSPTRAMFLLESSSKRGDFVLSDISVNSYNMMIIQNSYEQVFSDSKGYLESIKNVVRLV
jgi:hypothetical protein